MNDNFSPTDNDTALLAKCPTLRKYLNSVGAEQRSFRKYVIEVPVADEAMYGRVKRVRHDIRIDANGDVKCSPGVKPLPTEEELKAIREEVLAAGFPKSIGAIRGQLPPGLTRGPDVFEFASLNGEETIFVQHRVRFEDGGKHDLAHSYWSDGQWRAMEPDFPPDGLLPLYGLDKLRGSHRVIIHEGAKAARVVTEMCEKANRGELSDKSHPWLTALRYATSCGWPGGAQNPHRVDWSPIKNLPQDVEVTVVADNDQLGVDAVAKISAILRRTMTAIIFNNLFPAKFDLADDWPTHEAWWRGHRYVGPTFDDLLISATWATDRVPPPDGKGAPTIVIRDQFAAEWVRVEDPPLFIHRTRCDRFYKAEPFNVAVRPFSHAEDTARLLERRLSSKVKGIAYRPYRSGGPGGGVITVDGLAKLNTFRPPPIRPIKGDATPWLEFMANLIPDEGERAHLLKWCATLVARPEAKILFGVVLISQTQGTGKTTLGSAILAPLGGLWNVSFPSEDQIVDSTFNAWIARKRLAVCNEIYSGGKGRKGYDRLKRVVTDLDIDVNEKYISPYRVENWCHVFACSNSIKAIHIDDEDRRFLVPRVTEEKQPPAYWRKFYSWLNGEGLGIIAQWAEDYVTKHGAVEAGEPPPMTTAKMEMIAESRSDGQALAYDLATMVVEMPKVEADEEANKFVVLASAVREWVAERRGILKTDRLLERLLTIRKALRSGGLVEPKRKPGKPDARIMVSGVYECVFANFEIGPDVTWTKGLEEPGATLKKGLKDYLRSPVAIVDEHARRSLQVEEGKPVTVEKKSADKGPRHKPDEDPVPGPGPYDASRPGYDDMGESR